MNIHLALASSASEIQHSLSSCKTLLFLFASSNRIACILSCSLYWASLGCIEHTYTCTCPFLSLSSPFLSPPSPSPSLLPTSLSPLCSNPKWPNKHTSTKQGGLEQYNITNITSYWTPHGLPPFCTYTPVVECPSAHTAAYNCRTLPPATVWYIRK